MSNETMRKEFVAHHRVPDEAFYKESVDAYKYEQHPTIDHPVNELWESFCDGWQAARAQSEEPVAYLMTHPRRPPHCVTAGSSHKKDRESDAILGWEYTPLYPHPPAREQVPDAVTLKQIMKAREADAASDEFCEGLAEGWNSCRDAMLAAASQPPAQGCRPEALREKLFQGWQGCSNHGCIVTGPKTGIGTNGFCQCISNASRGELQMLQARLKTLLL